MSILGKAKIIDNPVVETFWDEKWKEKYDELMTKIKVPAPVQDVHAQQELISFEVSRRGSALGISENGSHLPKQELKE